MGCLSPREFKKCRTHTADHSLRIFHPSLIDRGRVAPQARGWGIKQKRGQRARALILFHNPNLYGDTRGKMRIIVEPNSATRRVYPLVNGIASKV